MSLCRGQFFFINNASILRAGIKRSVQHQLCNSHTGSAMAGASRTAALSHYVQHLFVPKPSPNMKAFNELPPSTGKSAINTQKRLFSTVAPRSFQLSHYPLAAAAAANAANGARSSAKLPGASRWPINSAKPLGYLCIGCSILVFAIVVLGGLTRLTESGLSITEWKPVTGAIPPLSKEDWEAEFSKYKESPEFKELNTDMTLDEYKFIYSMEWSHRLLGRIIGVLFVLPSLYYIARRKVSLPTAGKLLGICGLLGLQGFVGWWMVYSGIDKQNLDARHSKPTVSQYRLATHLAVAFTVYCAMISTGFSILRDYKVMAQPAKYQKIFQLIASPAIRPFKRLSKGVFGLVFITAMTGAIVAGLDAGMIYNTFPKMGKGYMPPKDELMDPMFARKDDKSDLWWRNMLENPTTAQFDHRVMAITTFLAIFAFHMYSHKVKAFMPRKAYVWTNVTMGLVSIQLALGICTLLWIVPTDLAAAHQAGALATLTGMLMVLNNLKRPSTSNIILLQRYLRKAAEQASKKTLK